MSAAKLGHKLQLYMINKKYKCTYLNVQLWKLKGKGYSTFLEIGSFYNSLRVKQLGLTIFESIQTIF